MWKFRGVGGICLLALVASSALAARADESSDAAETYAATDQSETPLTLPEPPRAAVGFDSVPSEQIDPIAMRLKIVEQLLRKHGRAYDYRIHTIKELQEILGRLDSSAKQP